MNTGNNLLFLIVSALLGFMASSGVLGWLNIKSVKALVHVPEEIYDGLPADFRIEVTNSSSRPLFLLKVRYREAVFPFITVPAADSASQSRSVVLHRRGEHHVGRIEVTSPFPVGFFVRSVSWGGEGAVVVFPAPKPCENGGPDGDMQPIGSTLSRRRGYEGEVTGIADYSGREPLKAVHWRLSARHGTLKVKQNADAASPPVIVRIAELPGASVEERLSCGAHIINAGIAAGRSVGLEAGAQVYPPGNTRGHRLRLLTELARYGSY